MANSVRYIVLFIFLTAIIAFAGISRIVFSSTIVNLHSSKGTPNKVLQVPLVEQPQQFACNVTAAAMVLQFKGVNVTPWEIYNALPKQEAKRENGFWGNPNLGFVGNVYGEYGGDKTRGYGVHWDPIAKYINQFKTAEVKRKWNLKEMLTEIDNGNPSIIWMQNDFDKPDTIKWNTYDENRNEVEITGVEGMHSEVLIGYYGSPENPVELVFNDPWAERWDYRAHSLPIKDFERLWAYYNQTAVVVK